MLGFVAHRLDKPQSGAVQQSSIPMRIVDICISGTSHQTCGSRTTLAIYSYVFNKQEE
jgi:hypothetical protein